VEAVVFAPRLDTGYSRGRNVRRLLPWAAAVVLCALILPEPAHAYIGPGAGFAVGTTLVTLFFAVFSALAALLLWPFRSVIRAVRRRRAHAHARVRRVVVLGLDGLEPRLLDRYMGEGKLPNFQRLAERGTYTKLGTTAPAMTPVAWASFLTGCNPGKHNIFDFLTRDKRTYLPMLSSVQIGPPRKVLRFGKYRIPLGKPDVRLLRKGKPFWNTLGEHGIFSNIIRMPITFPPEKFRGVLLSAMCVPDLRGSQGTFSFYTSAGAQGPRGQAVEGSRVEGEEYTGGEQIRVQLDGDRVRSHLIGPENTIVEHGGNMRCPFEVRVTGATTARLRICGQTHPLVCGEYSQWVKLKFRAGLGISVSGICQFLLLETRPEFKLYVTPIQIDPDSPALQISHPKIYATYLSKLIGTYATLGLAEDTWGLNGRVLDDRAFLEQCIQIDEERMDMFFDALDKTRRGLCVCVVDGPDRVHHMFWRYIDPAHPARQGQGGREQRNAIEEMYLRMDELVGDTLAACDDKGTLLLVISDHGCASFRRGVDLNCWLEQNGYLKLKPDARGRKYLQGVDWTQTQAYCVGLTGLWLNIAGREAQGVVNPADAPALRTEIAKKLTGLKDESAGAVAINRVLDANKVYSGPYKDEAPDLIVGYNDGYRVSWDAAIGLPTGQLFHDNAKAWSGDHIIDPLLVPGVLLSNRKIAADQPHITDLAPTILELFGVRVPEQMDGRALKVAEADGSFSGEPCKRAEGEAA
jgi:predicted AlkP superfamily phosphohydrolase/phosphomutase